MTTYDYEMEVLNVFRNINEELASIERLIKTLIKNEDKTSSSFVTYDVCKDRTTNNDIHKDCTTDNKYECKYCATDSKY